MTKWTFILLLVLIVQAGHAQTFFDDEGDSTVVTEYRDGKQWAYKKAEGYIVGVSCNETKDDYGSYYQTSIVIYNLNDRSVDFIPEDVEARLTTTKGRTQQLKVYTNEKFQRKIKRAQEWSMALYGLAAGINAGSSTTSSSYMENMAAIAQIDEMDRVLDNERATKQVGYMKRNTIHPGECIAGYMNIKRQTGYAVTINIPIDGHVFRFDWEVAK